MPPTQKDDDDRCGDCLGPVRDGECPSCYRFWSNKWLHDEALHPRPERGRVVWSTFLGYYTWRED